MENKKGRNLTETLLNAEERKVYRLSRIERKNRDEIVAEMSLAYPAYSIERLKDTLKKIDGKVYVSSRYDALSALSEKYVRVLKVLRDYFEEKSSSEKEHVFNIDFSDVYVYLNPSELARDYESQILRDNNFGSIYYMLNSTNKNKYCMLPPAIWEAIHRLYAIQELLKQTSSSAVISSLKAYYHLMDDPARFSTGVIKQYNSMSNILTILDLASKGDLVGRSKSNCSNTISLLNGRIKRVDDFVDDVGQVSIHTETYEDAFCRLKKRRPDENKYKNNVVDATNVAITYDLTAKSEDKCFRLVSHSRQPSLAFKNIKLEKEDREKMNYRHDVLLSCCPQFVATVILAENDKLEGFDSSNFKNNGAYFSERIRVLDGINSQCNDLKYGQMYLRSWNMEEHTSLMEKTLVDQTAHIETALTSMYNHIVDLSKFRNQIYPSFIGSLLDINSGKDEKARADKKFIGSFDDDLGDLLEMCENEQRYKKLVEDAAGIIHDELKETYKGLGKYVEGKYKHLLKPNMQSLLNELYKEM